MATMHKPLIRFNGINLLIIALIAAGIWPLIIFAQADQPATETLLHATTAWDGAPYVAYPQGTPELNVVKVTIPARGIVPWHSHPIPAAGYLLSGEITIEEENGAHHKFTAGQVISEPVNVIHRGTAGDQGAVIIAFFAAAEGTPLSQPKP